jgi:hypothetical protein
MISNKIYRLWNIKNFGGGSTVITHFLSSPAGEDKKIAQRQPG